MKISLITISVILLILATAFAGCADSLPSVSTKTIQTQGATTYAKMSGTTVETTTLQTPAKVQNKVAEIKIKIFNGDYHSAEYQNTVSVTMPPNPRSSWVYTSKLERTTTEYRGIPAIYYKITTVSDYPELFGNEVTITKNGRSAIDNSYYSTSTGEFLGEDMTETIKGVTKPTENFSAGYSAHRQENKPAGDMGFVPFCEMNITLVYQGTESVTVAAGTYPETRKYLGQFKDGTPITFGVAPGVPVPVKYEFPNKYLDGDDPFQSYELKNWG